MTPLPAAALAFCLTVLAVKMLDGPARALGLVDRPGGRKVHARPVPLTGGLSVMAGFVLASLMLPAGLPGEPAFGVGLAVIMLMGLVDDARGLAASMRFGIQLVVALIVALWGGVVINSLGVIPFTDGAVLTLGVLAVPVTVFAIVGFMNSMNMMDGADGLAAGVSLVIVIGLAGAAALAGDTRIPGIALVLAGALAGFLVFNLRAPWRRRASVFLGDHGSLALGLVVIWLAIETATLPGRAVAPVAIGWLLVVPVIETLNLIIRRLVRGQSPFHADREHLHHILRRAGFSVGQTTAIIMALVALLGVVGLAASALGVAEGWLWAGLIMLAVTHLIFTESGWRTVLAIQRLRQWRPAPGTQAPMVRAPLAPGRRMLAATGFYLMAATLPFDFNMPALGLAIVTVAVVMPGGSFSRSLLREPTAWLVIALAGWVVIQAVQAGASPIALWHGLALSGVAALPLGWWLAGHPRHLAGGGMVLIAGLGVAAALRGAAPGDGLIRQITHGPADGLGLLAAMPLIGCLLVLVRPAGRLVRARLRVRDVLIGGTALGVGLWLGQLSLRSIAAGLVADPSRWQAGWGEVLARHGWLGGAPMARVLDAPSDLASLALLTGLPGLILFAVVFTRLLIPVWRLHQAHHWPLRWTSALLGFGGLLFVLLAVTSPLRGVDGGLVLTTGMAVLWMASIQEIRLRRGHISQ